MPITGYKVFSTNSYSNTALAYNGRGITATTADIPGLAAGQVYSFVVSGLSAAGEGEPSAVLSQSTALATPADLTSQAQTSTSVVLTWTVPTVSVSDEAEPVTEYKVHYEIAASAASHSTLLRSSSVDGYPGSDPAATIEGLMDGRLYRVANLSRSHTHLHAMRMAMRPGLQASWDVRTQASTRNENAWRTALELCRHR